VVVRNVIKNSATGSTPFASRRTTGSPAGMLTQPRRFSVVPPTTGMEGLVEPRP
jgi:hypothetical protein